ncbi:MAG: tail fiber domain-containing protein [Chitinophagaceae bacterium]|nr:tail fiber domain-containing protein [Nitrosomonas sp.]MCW5929869.1 tail fiber domain-containing protein [Chitinophagaceae bacterium]
MATTVNDRDLFLSGETRTFPGVIPSDFEFTGNVTGTLNGLPVQEVIDAAYTQGGSGDITADVLSNSATSILMTSSALFKTTTGNGGVFIGGGGLFGRNTSGINTFAIDGATGNVSITGALSATSTIDGTTAALIRTGAAVGQTLVDASGQITLGGADKIRAGSGTAGVFFGSSGIFGRNTSGVTTFAIDATNGNVAITGTLSSTSVIGSTSASTVEQGAAIGAILPSATGQITLGSAGKLRTGSGTSRVEFGSTGIFGYSGGVQTFGLSSNGSFSLTGGSVGGSVDIAGTLASVIGPGAANGATLTSGSGSLILGSSDKLKSGSGVAGVFFGSNGFFGRNSSGVTTFGISSSSGAATFLGTITGGSNINISGQATFDGNNTVGGVTAAMHVNDSLASANGIVARSSSGISIQGLGQGTSGDGVYGQATGSSGVGVVAVHTGGGVALQVSGRMTMSNTTTVANLSADMVDGLHSSSFCRTIGSHNGTAVVSSSHFNILTTVGGYTTTGGGSNITFAPSSDERLKQDIAPEPLGLDFVSALNPVEYRLKSNPTMKYHGFIAQHVAPLISATDDCLYQTNPDGMLGVDYVGLIAPMVNAIKELKARVEFLEGQIA